MQIAQTLSGYTLGGADLLRRAMGKKKPEEMATPALGVRRRRGRARRHRRRAPGYIFDLIEKFAGYGFNKSHSVAYALLAYQTAWLKAHYPEAFMAAVLSCDMEHTDKVVSFIDECAGIGIEVLPPDVNAVELRLHGRGPGHDPLRPRRDQGRGRGRGGGDRRRARARRRVPRPGRPVPARGPQARGQAHARGDGESRLLRRLRPHARLARRRAAGRHPARRAAHARDTRRARTTCSAASQGPRPRTSAVDDRDPRAAGMERARAPRRRARDARACS